MERRAVYLLVYGLQVPAERLVFDKHVVILCFIQSRVFIWLRSILKNAVDVDRFVLIFLNMPNEVG